MRSVAFLVPEIVNCGPVNVVLNTINYLSDNEIKILLIAVRKTKNNQKYLGEFESVIKKNIYYLDDSNSHNLRLQEILINENIDVVHSHGYYPDKLSANLNINVKKISTVHCMFYKDYPKEYGLLKGLFGAFLHSFILKRSNFKYIVGCSNSVANYCKVNLRLSKVLAINNGVDQNKYFILSESERLKRRSELGFVGKKIFIFSGRFIRRKRVPELLKFFKSQSYENSILLLLGDGPEKMECEKNFLHDNIKFLGQISNPEKYYQIADFVISNSEAEGYPMSIIEATSCGCYALLSNIPPHKEFIDNNPECASFIDEVNLKNFNAFKFNKNTITNLSAKVMTDKYIKIYRD